MPFSSYMHHGRCLDEHEVESLPSGRPALPFLALPFFLSSARRPTDVVRPREARGCTWVPGGWWRAGRTGLGLVVYSVGRHEEGPEVRCFVRSYPPSPSLAARSTLSDTEYCHICSESASLFLVWALRYLPSSATRPKCTSVEAEGDRLGSPPSLSHKRVGRANHESHGASFGRRAACDRDSKVRGIRGGQRDCSQQDRPRWKSDSVPRWDRWALFCGRVADIAANQLGRERGGGGERWACNSSAWRGGVAEWDIPSPKPQAQRKAKCRRTEGFSLFVFAERFFEIKFFSPSERQTLRGRTRPT